jgi:hypothetical protein
MPEHPPLEIGFWLSQILLSAVALLAACFAFFQLRTYKLLEIMKYIEDEDFRTFRRTVIMEIGPIGHTNWWDTMPNAAELEQAAAAVCARYDILGLMIEFDKIDRWVPGGYGKFFTRDWAESIIRTHDALENYIAYRSSTAKFVDKAYPHFTRLRDRARQMA